MVNGIFNAIPFGVIKDAAGTFLYTCSGLSSKACLIRRGNHGPGNQDFLADLGPLM